MNTVQSDVAELHQAAARWLQAFSAPHNKIKKDKTGRTCGTQVLPRNVGGKGLVGTPRNG